MSLSDWIIPLALPRTTSEHLDPGAAAFLFDATTSVSWTAAHTISLMGETCRLLIGAGRWMGHIVRQQAEQTPENAHSNLLEH